MPVVPSYKSRGPGISAPDGEVYGDARVLLGPVAPPEPVYAAATRTGFLLEGPTRGTVRGAIRRCDPLAKEEVLDQRLIALGCAPQHEAAEGDAMIVQQALRFSRPSSSFFFSFFCSIRVVACRTKGARASLNNGFNGALTS